MIIQCKDYIYGLLETYGGKISCWAWNKRWADKKKGTGYIAR
jgi:hypothetical protein|tara:strand:+ start:4580 stop:4705 length:126 start_codon:yes stop_codon:yes gene_type:complete